MISKKTIWVLTFIIISISCTKENSDMRTSEMDSPVITGFVFRDLGGNIIDTIGYPNNKTVINPKDFKSRYGLLLYPNPINKDAYLEIGMPNKLLRIYIWIIESSYLESISNVSLNGSMLNLVANGNPVVQYSFESIMEDIHTGSGGISNFRYYEKQESLIFHLSDIPNGYYRIYIKIGDELLFENIIINNSNN